MTGRPPGCCTCHGRPVSPDGRFSVNPMQLVPAWRSTCDIEVPTERRTASVSAGPSPR
ncbi:MAG: hypothetical protein AB1730_06820 [Myxococcota bacterium]